MRHVLLLTALLALPSCFLSRTSVNEPLRPKQLERLVPGTTTAAEVLDLLGAPTEVVQLGRRSAYRFDASTSKQTGLWVVVLALVNEDTRSDRAWVFFDEEDVLTHVGATFQAREPQYAMPWTDIHDD
jgi:hypothetical protein